MNWKCLRDQQQSNAMHGKLRAESLLMIVVLFPEIIFFSAAAGKSQWPDLDDVATLNILALGPYPSTISPSWAGGPALIPSAQLAADLINNHSSLLHGYRLNIVPVDGGCNHIGTLYVNLFEKLFFDVYHGSIHGQTDTTVGIVGPGCSEAAVNLAPLLVKGDLNLMQITIATTPEINGDDNKYDNTFRTVSSALKFVDAFQSLLHHTRWKRFAVLYDHSRRYHTELYKEFKKSISHDVYSSGVEDFLLEGVFETLRNDRIRIIFVFAGEEAARRILCVAYNQSKIFPTHQWIFTERDVSNFNETTSVTYASHNQEIKCSKYEMLKALNGVILSEFEFEREVNDTKKPSNISLDDYKEQYDEYYKQHLNKHNLNESDVTKGAEQYAFPYFDAVWALALSLNSSLEELDEQNLTLLDYCYNRSSMCAAKRVGNVIRKHIKALDFNDTFNYDNSTRSIASSVAIKVTRFNFIEGKAIPVCLHINNEAESCSINFRLDDKFIIDDEFTPVIRKPPFSLGMFILIVAIVTLLAVALLHFLFLYHSDKRSIKASSPAISNFIFSGNYISLVAVLSYTSKETFVEYVHQRPVHYGVLCSTVMWCNVFAITLVFGTLCVKTWRIYRIFGFFRQGRVRYASDGILILFVLLLLLIDLMYLLAWNVISPWRINNNVSTSGDHVINLYTCECDQLIYWLVPLVAYKGVLAAVVVYLSILIRRIKRKEFDFSKYMIALIYLLLLLYAVLIPMYILFIAKIQLLSFLALNMLALATVYASCVFLFLPPLRLVWVKSRSKPKKSFLPKRRHHAPIITFTAHQ